MGMVLISFKSAANEVAAKVSSVATMTEARYFMGINLSCWALRGEMNISIGLMALLIGLCGVGSEILRGATSAMPDPLVMKDGTRVTTAEQWRTRREEMKGILRTY